VALFIGLSPAQLAPKKRPAQLTHTPDRRSPLLRGRVRGEEVSKEFAERDEREEREERRRREREAKVVVVVWVVMWWCGSMSVQIRLAMRCTLCMHGWLAGCEQTHRACFNAEYKHSCMMTRDRFHSESRLVHQLY
jgi:hypothetical protein